MSFKLKYAPILFSMLVATSSVAKAENTKLTMSSWVPATHWIFTEGFLPWTKKVAEVTEGRVEITVLPKPVGAPHEHFDLARKGVVDITYGTYTYQPQRFKIFEFLEFPLGNADAERTSVAAWRTFQRHFTNDNTHQEVKLLSLFMMGTGSIHHSKNVMGSVEDFAGQKLRMGGPIQKAVIAGLGATPVSAPVSKSYELLSSNVIDGSLNPFSDVLGFRLDEQLPYHTEVAGGFFDASIFLVMHKASFDKISPQDQAAIMEISGENFAQKMGQHFSVRNEGAREVIIRGGGTVEQASAELTDAVRSIRAELVQDWAAYAQDLGYQNAGEILAEYWNAIQVASEE